MEVSVARRRWIDTKIESVLNNFNNLTSTPYVTAKKVTQIIGGETISSIFVLGNILDYKLSTLNLFWRKNLGTHISMYFITIFL